MPYQIIKYENAFAESRAGLGRTDRRPQMPFVGLTLVVLYVHIIVDNSTEQFCVANEHQKNKK